MGFIGDANHFTCASQGRVGFRIRHQANTTSAGLDVKEAGRHRFTAVRAGRHRASRARAGLSALRPIRLTSLEIWCRSSWLVRSSFELSQQTEVAEGGVELLPDRRVFELGFDEDLYLDALGVGQPGEDAMAE